MDRASNPACKDLDRRAWQHLLERLREAGIRPTPQRVALGLLLFSKGDRHVTADQLHEEATRANIPVSLATIYNTLHHFTEAKLLREVAVDGSRTHFYTSASKHHHFFIEDENRLVDIPETQLRIDHMLAAPEGFEIVRADVVVRLRRIRE